MERESFEDAQVADILNRDFISIKLDREERPDIDSVYMSVTQLLTGSGGWPMSVFMDAQQRPFFAGTYFPKQDSRRGPGFITLLTRTADMWHGNRQQLMRASGELAIVEPDRKKDIDYVDAIQKGYTQLKARFDQRYGGFGTAPKFPSPHNLLLLLRYYHAFKDPAALQMTETTLTAMYRGGIRDHVGHGFSRYSTDRKWLAPHFEKMLYDNALLAAAYCETFQITKNPFYRRAADEIFEYVARDMTSPEGAFYSAEDADSEGEEGRFYTFTRREVIAVLGDTDGERFCREYGITDSGNFEGKNILNLIDNEDFTNVLQNEFYAVCLRRLYDYRSTRVRPLRDDKILSSWNGLMIYALSYAGRTLGNAEYVRRAAAAADFVLARMTDKDGRLLTRCRDGEARFTGVAEDYAYIVMGLIELYQASFDVKYLTEAYRLNQILLDDFCEDGALYQTGKNGDKLIHRPRELYDGAMPSYNSVSVSNFAKLSQLCSDPELMDRAEGIIRFFGADIESAPIGFAFALCGMMLLTGKRQLVIAGGGSSELVGVVNSAYEPFATLCLASGELAEAFGFYKGFIDKADIAAAYLCEGSHCNAPIYDTDTLRKTLNLEAKETI